VAGDGGTAVGGADGALCVDVGDEARSLPMTMPPPTIPTARATISTTSRRDRRGRFPLGRERRSGGLFVVMAISPSITADEAESPHQDGTLLITMSSLRRS
jgi:hypothetical protein